MGRQYYARKSPCPACGTTAGVPIMYGVVDPELYDAVERAEIVVGEPNPGPDAPEWACSECGHRWQGRPAPRRRKRR